MGLTVTTWQIKLNQRHYSRGTWHSKYPEAETMGNFFKSKDGARKKHILKPYFGRDEKTLISDMQFLMS